MFKVAGFCGADGAGGRLDVRAGCTLVVEVASRKGAGAVVGPLLLPLRVTLETLPLAVKLVSFQLVFTFFVSLR